jgi:hypothetical protein
MLGQKGRGFLKPLLLFNLFFYSCDNTESKVDLVQYNMPIGVDQEILYLQPILVGDSLFGYNYHSHSIDLIRIDSSLSTPGSQYLKLEKFGPDKVGTPENTFFYDGSLYLLDIHNNLTVINIDTKQINRVQLEFEHRGNKMFTGKGISYNKPSSATIFKNTVSIPLYKSGYRNRDGYYDSLYFGKINLNNYQFEIISIPYPSDFQDNYWPVHDDHYVQQIADSLYVISFKGISDIFIGNAKGELKRYVQDMTRFGIDGKVDSKSKTMSRMDAIEDKLYLNGSPYYSPIYYQESENMLYRLVKGKTDDKGFNQTKNLHLFKYNLELEVVNHASLPEGLLPRFILGEKGAYFQHSTLTSQSEDFFRLSHLKGF